MSLIIEVYNDKTYDIRPINKLQDGIVVKNNIILIYVLCII